MSFVQAEADGCTKCAHSPIKFGEVCALTASPGLIGGGRCALTA